MRINCGINGLTQGSAAILQKVYADVFWLLLAIQVVALSLRLEGRIPPGFCWIPAAEGQDKPARAECLKPIPSAILWSSDSL